MSISSSCWRDTSYFLGEYTQDPDHWPLFFSGNTSLWGEPSFSNALICKTNQAEPSRKCMWIWIKGIVLEIDTINPTALSSQFSPNRNASGIDDRKVPRVAEAFLLSSDFGLILKNYLLLHLIHRNFFVQWYFCFLLHLFIDSANIFWI